MDADSTCWTTLRAAAGGRLDARAAFAERYAPMIRAYLAARWRSSPLLDDLDDAIQDVFVECLRQGGGLESARADRPGGFRAFLFGIVRHVAQRLERRRARSRERSGAETDEPEADETSLARAFDRAWARAILREAAELQERRASGRDESARRRVDLLRLRFRDGLPIRAIARAWDLEPAALHHEYARARAEFRAALIDVLAFHHPAAPEEIERECRELLALLS